MKALGKTTVVFMGMLALSACKVSVGSKKETPPPPPAAEPPPPPPPAAPKIQAVKKKDPPNVKIVGDHLEIDQKIMFETDSAVIKPESSDILDQLAQILQNHTEFTKVHVIGHTDTTGDDQHNQELSDKRAAAVVQALKDRGVSQSIDSRGAGETELSCTETTPECHEQNRRVEFKVEQG